MTRPRSKRSRSSARSAGAQFNADIARYLAEHIDDRIEVRHSTGAKDRGDVSSVRSAHGHRVVIECKNESTGLNLGSWQGEAEVERGNDDALVAVVSHKRHGKGDPGDQWITMTTRDLVALITGVRP